MVSSASNSPAFQRFQSILKDVRAATEPGTEAGKKVGDVEAQKIVEAFARLDGSEKLTAGTALKGLLQADIFEVTDGARATFAKALGVDANDLKPQPAATGVKRSVLEHTFQLLTGPVKVDGADLKKLHEALKGTSPQIADFITHAMNEGSADGTVKMEGDARKTHVKEFASRNQDGRLDVLAEKFGDDFAKRVPPYVLSALSSPPKFEELIFILMITIVSDTQKEVMEEQKRISDVVSQDKKHTELKAERSKQMGNIASGAGQKKVDVGIDRPDGDPTARGRQGKGDDVAKTKRQIEGALGAIHGSLRNDGQVDVNESKAIIKRFDAFEPGVRKLFAEAVGTAIEHSGALAKPGVQDNIAPIWEWAKKTAGKDSFPAPTPPTEPDKVAAAFIGSQDLDKRLAGFLIDAFLDKKNVGQIALHKQKSTETIKKFQPVIDDLVKQCHNPAATDAVKAPTTPQGTDGAVLARMEKLVGAQNDVHTKLAALKQQPVPTDPAKKAAHEKQIGSLENALKSIAAGVDKTVEREMAGKPPEQIDAMKAAVKTALSQLPQDGPASQQDVETAFRAATGKLQEFILDEKDPNVDGVIGGHIESALQFAAGKIENITDSGSTAPSKDDQRKLLQDAIAQQHIKLVQEVQQHGMNPDQVGRMVELFDKAAQRELAKFDASGKIEPKEPLGRGRDSVDPEQSDDTRSRQIMFENLKFKMNMLSEMMQSMSNILNTLHQNAENTIRAIR